MPISKLGLPPYTGLAALDDWTRQVSQILEELPEMSIISTSAGPEGNTVASMGHIAVDIGSSTTKLWLKHTDSATSTGWKAYQFV